MTKPTWQDLFLGSRNAAQAATLCVTILFAIIAGCTSQAADRPSSVDEKRNQEEQTVDTLIDGLDDESESVRQKALAGLEDSLKRKIYFDPTASAADREKALEDVRAMWQNLKDRELLDDVQQRAPLDYFYDLNTAKLFEAKAGPGPIETPSGPFGEMPAGVRAVVFSCEDCARERYVGWVQVPITELDRYGIEYDSEGFVADEDTTVFWAVRSTNGGPWTLLGSPASETIMSAAKQCAERPVPLFCRPGR